VVKSFEVSQHHEARTALNGGFQDGKYHIQVRSELGSDETLEMDEHKVRELKVSDRTPCPVAGSHKSYVH
jgi:hypothetical protein